MPRRKKGYKNNNLISTYINNSIVDSNKRKKEAAREAAREKKTKARAQIANEKERKRLEAANAKAQKSRDKERQKQEQETARKNERILKILKNLEINFENNKLYPNREVLTCVSIQCHEAAITAGSAFKTYAQPRLDTIMIKSAQAYIDTKIERANESEHYSQLLNKVTTLATSFESIEHLEKSADNSSEFLLVQRDIHSIIDAEEQQKLINKERNEFLNSIQSDLFEDDFTDLKEISHQRNLTSNQIKNLDDYKALKDKKADYINSLDIKLAKKLVFNASHNTGALPPPLPDTFRKHES